MSKPARSNMPPFATKEFCMSTTMIAVRSRSMSTGSGFACNLTMVVLPRIVSPVPIALVEVVGSRDIGRRLPRAADTRLARQAEVLHQVDAVVAQAKPPRHAVDRLDPRDVDVRRGRS